jgi:DNA-binding LytR/AlgR family response regulator
MRALNCIVVEDDELDRLMVVCCIKRFPHLSLKGVFENADEALNAVNFEDLDVLFLDIDMPGLKGIELRKRAHFVPACIFISSYPEYALDSYSLETLDFILKPLSYERFAQAIDRLDRYMEIKNQAHLYETILGGHSVYIKEGHFEIKLKLNEITYLEALKDYTIVKTSDRKYCVLSSIGNLLKQEGFRKFVRIHRSFAVRKDFIRAIGGHEVVLKDDSVLPIGRSFKENASTLF